jgi:hypothetical protein
VFYPPSEPLLASSYTHLEIYNHRADFIERIEPLQDRVNEYEYAVDSALEVLSANLPPTNPSLFLQQIRGGNSNDKDDSPSLASSTKSGTQNQNGQSLFIYPYLTTAYCDD